MYDDLSRIERCYGSVAEYYRSQQEDYEHEYEMRERANERYRANQAKIRDAQEAGKHIIKYGGEGACYDCPFADCDTQTSFDDDWELVVCSAEKHCDVWDELEW